MLKIILKKIEDYQSCKYSAAQTKSLTLFPQDSEQRICVKKAARYIKKVDARRARINALKQHLFFLLNPNASESDYIDRQIDKRTNKQRE